jgi:hypothetical protein
LNSPDDRHRPGVSHAILETLIRADARAIESAEPRRELQAQAQQAVPNAERIFYHALRAGFTFEEIFNLTKIDRWFLVQIMGIVNSEEELAARAELNGIVVVKCDRYIARHESSGSQRRTVRDRRQLLEKDYESET